MQYIYIVIDRKQGFIYGAYAKMEDAQKVFNELISQDEMLEISLTQEPILQKPAHFPNK